MQVVKQALLGAAVFGMALSLSACKDGNAMASQASDQHVKTSPANQAHTVSAPTGQVKATEIIFIEQEKHIPPYQTRVLVTPRYLRFDDGAGSRDFILYKRKEHVIYRVNSSDRTIMSIDDHGIAIKPPFDLKLAQKDLGPMKDAPKVGGTVPVHYEFSAGGQLCYDVIAVPGLMPGALAALREFRQVLAADSTHTFNRIPADLQNACDMARSTFAPNRHLSKGFPIQEWRKDGYQRGLKSYKLDDEVDASLFQLPKGYQRYNIQDFREGKVRTDG